MRRLIHVVLSVGLLLVAAAPVAAGKPIGACPNPSFQLLLISEFRSLSISVGVPEALLGDAWAAGIAAIDKNSDGRLCVKDVPDTAGHLGSWIFNVVDNTANS